MLLSQHIKLTIEMIKSTRFTCRIINDTLSTLRPFFLKIYNLSIFIISNNSRRFLWGRYDVFKYFLLLCKITQNVYLSELRISYLEGRKKMKQKKKQCH